jgi:hypothetical protein
MTDKYVNGKWADPKQKHDPMFLFENRPKKFDRWVKKMIEKHNPKAVEEDEESDDEIKLSKKEKLNRTEKPQSRRRQ